MTKLLQMKTVCFLVFTGFLIVGCKSAQPYRTQAEVQSFKNTYMPNQLETEVLALVNSARTSGYKCGHKYLPPVGKLRINEELSMAALRQARDMASANFFSHTGINGNTAGDRISGAGYTWSTSGENIAAGQRTPKNVVENWLKSPGHCENIMNGRFQNMGVARAVSKNSKFKVYWVQTFGVN